MLGVAARVLAVPVALLIAASTVVAVGLGMAFAATCLASSDNMTLLLNCVTVRRIVP